MREGCEAMLRPSGCGPLHSLPNLPKPQRCANTCIRVIRWSTACAVGGEKRRREDQKVLSAVIVSV